MKKLSLALLALFLTISLVACPSGPSAPEVNYKNDSVITVTPKNGEVTIDTQGEKKDVYLVISNPSTSAVSIPTLTGYKASNAVAPTSYYAWLDEYGPDSNLTLVGDIPEPNDMIYSILPINPEVPENLNNIVSKSTWTSPYTSMGLGDQRQMYVQQASGYGPVTCSVREKRTVTTAFGPKTLFIFVEDAVWNKNLGTYNGETCIIDNAFIQDQANAFLKDGLNNDIYDYVTTAYGEEYGEIVNNGMYRTDSDEIIIVFGQIGGATSLTGGIGGYYSSACNAVPGYESQGWLTNEGTTIVINAYIASATPSTSKTILAHEFQHAVFNYQRTRKIGGRNEPDWINEMFSALAEDLVAEYLGVPGPAENSPLTGKAPYDPGYLEYNGRIPQYFAAQRYNVADWEGNSGIQSLYPYGLVYSLGSYLVRNYNSSFIKHYNENAENDTTDEGAFENLIESINATNPGANLTKAKLLADWGAAILLSSKTDIERPYRLNTGGWITDLNNSSIKLPSLNYYHYILRNDVSYAQNLYDGGSSACTQGPTVFNQFADRNYSVLNGKTMNPNTNIFVLIERDVIGEKTFGLQNNPNLRYTVVLK